MEIKIGDTFGDYTVEDFISASGVSGTVWKVSKESKGSVRNLAEFALKVLKGQLNPDRADIRTEAVNWSRISQHPNIADFVDIAIQEDEYEDEYVGFVSHFYKENLRQYLRKACLQTEEAVKLAIGILKGLQHIHDEHIIHRDLKPENILISYGVPYIIDFGISRFVSENMTLRPTRSLGTMEYAAPEAWDHLSHSIRPESDIWSVGVLLYEMIEGSRPFAGSEDKFERIVRDEPPRAFSKEIPPDLKQIILKCLRKQPSERYLSADAMRVALEKHQNCERTRRAIESQNWEVSVQQISEGDSKQEEFLNLYSEIFPDDGTVLTRDQVAEILVPNLPDRIVATDNIPIIACHNDELLGFIVCCNYEEFQMAFIPYFAVKPGVSPRFETSKKLLERLYALLREKQCNYVFFEAQILESTKARVERFAELCDQLGYEFRQFNIDYVGPKPHLNAREDPLLFFGVGIREIIENRISKEQMTAFLEFMFSKVYADTYPVDSEEFREYDAYLQSHLATTIHGLPDPIETILYPRTIE